MYKISIPFLVCGFGFQLVYLSAPQYFPNASPWVWGVIFYFGIAMIIIGIILILSSALPGTRKIRTFLLGYISLEKAAIKAFEKGRHTIMAAAAESATNLHQPNAKEYFAQWLIGTNDNPKMKVYGCKQQLSICEEIPHTEIYGNDLRANDKGDLVLKDRTYKHIKYHKLYVKRKEFNDRLTEIQKRFKDI